MAQAILIFSPHSSLYPSAARKVKVRLHWVINTLALVSAVAGVGAIYYNKILGGKAHFTTWHGLIGIVTLAMVCVQCVAGIFPLNPGLMKVIRPSDLKLYHATSGMLVTMLVSLSLILGMQSNWFTKRVTGTSWYACVACPIVILVVVSQQVTQEYLQRRVTATSRSKGASSKVIVKTDQTSDRPATKGNGGGQTEASN